MKNTSYLIIFLLFLFSCNQDEIIIDEVISPEPEPEEMTQFFDFSFSSEGSFSPSVNFLVLSDNNGVTLYDTVGAELDFDVTLEIDSGTDVNATIGFMDEESFNNVSYSKIKSASQLNLSRDWETHPCFQTGPVDVSSMKLFITDIDEFYETINFDSWLTSSTIELKGDTLILDGGIPFQWGNSVQIAIREQENSELMSLIIPYDDWEWDNDSQSRYHTVSFNDFSSTEEYLIDLDRTDRWNLKAKVCDRNGSVIALQTSKYSSLMVDQVKLFINQAVEVSELKLNITNHNYEQNWILPSIPESIELAANRDPTFLHIEAGDFSILNTFHYNINVLKYSYPGEFNWSIISKGGANVSFINPKLPSQLHETFDFLEDLLENPIFATNTMYRTEKEFNDITKVHKSVIPRAKNSNPDFNYSSKKTSISF